jgi:hypothetical protein
VGVLKPQWKTKKTISDTKDYGDKKPRIGDLVEQLKFPDQKWVVLRMVGPTVNYGIHWVETKKKDGNLTRFPAVCLSWDSESEIHDSTKECPWCDAQDKRIKFQVDFYQNAIVRRLQEQEPKSKPDNTSKEEKTRFKEKDSDSWTPIRVIRMTRSVVRELKRHSQLNKHKSKKTGEVKVWPLSHDHWGCDIKVMYDSTEKTPAKKYTVSVNVDTTTALSEEEQEYLQWNIEGLQTPDTLEQARVDFEKWIEKMGDPKKKKEDGEEEEEAPKRKKQDHEEEYEVNEDKPKKKKVQDDDDDEPKKKKKADPEDDDIFGSDDSEEEAPKKKKKAESDDDSGLDFDE